MKRKRLLITISLIFMAFSAAHASGLQKFLADDPAGRDTITFESEAPLEDIVGTTNQVKGYVDFNPDNPTSGAKAEFTVPTASLNTGIPLRDEHLRSPDWLNAEAFPEIKLVLDQVTTAEPVRENENSKTFDLEVSGELTLHGVTRPVTMEARVTYLPESEKTKTRLPGNILAIRTEFDVLLADYGITGPGGVIGSKVGESIEIEVTIFASTVKPE